MNRIFIVGFMGCGKTTIANALQQCLSNFTFVDTDLIIEQITGTTITQLFANKGEAYFRNEEVKLITMLINTPAHTIVATGGGLPLHNNLMHTMNTNGITVYLKLSAATLATRLKAQKQTRPLIATIPDANLQHYVEQLLHEREQTYNKATYTINAEQPLNEVVGAIIAAIKS